MARTEHPEVMEPPRILWNRANLPTSHNVKGDLRQKVGNRRGFTLIEASVMIMIIVILAALIVPKYAAMKSSRDVLSFIDGLPRIASQAREAAISKNETAKITYNQGQQRLDLTLVKTDEPDTLVTSLTVPSSVNLDGFQVAGQTNGPTDFTLQFYADGGCDGGDIETDVANRYRTLVVDTNGVAKLQDGPIPTATTDVWPAGNFLQRATTNAP